MKNLFTFICLIVLLNCLPIYPQQRVTARLDINNLNALEANNGFSDYNLNSNLEGLEYPKGSGKTAIFESGFLWGGFVHGDPQVRVGGSAYISGLQPGPIINGAAANPNDVKYSIYRVRPDVYPGGPSVNLSSDATLEGVPESQLRAQYESDWTNWPAAGTANDLGAPFKDVNGDGKYEPGIDIPGVPGAGQTIYYVANDLNKNNTAMLYGAQPLGIELHVTYWAFAQSGVLNNTYFKKWDIINKGTSTIDSMFVSLFMDADLGNANDDLVGCDTTLSLQYTYNGEPTDAVYAPLPPPAVGSDFLQGPTIAGSSSDSAIFNGRVVHGKRNLPITAAYFFVNGDPNFGDPPQGSIMGSTQYYHFFNGQYGLSGSPFIDNKGHQTKFAFYGDPLAGTGWLDGVTLPMGDRRQGMASGPFNMAPGDTQEVVIAEMLADKDTIPDSYLTSITNLKNNTKYVQSIYRSGVVVSISSLDIVNINSKVDLKANIVPAGSQVSSINWSITSKPEGSNAAIANPSALNTSFTPDLKGDYNIKLSLTINGIEVYDIKLIKAINDQKPIAILKIDNPEISSSDSVLLRFDASYDPDGDSLSFALNGPGIFSFNTASKSAYFYPNPGFVGNGEIELLASDLYYSDTATVKIKVDPVLANTKINYSYIDTAWQLSGSTNPLNGNLFFIGKDTLYVPLLNSLRRYTIKSDGIEIKEDINNIKISGIWAIKNNLLFGSANTSLGVFGTLGQLNIFDLNNNGAPLLKSYLPGNMDILSFYQIGSDIYLLDALGNIFKMDFSTPSLPRILSSNQISLPNQLQFNTINLFSSDNQFLYFIVRKPSDNTYFAKKLDRNSLLTADSLSLPFIPSSGLAIHDSLIVESGLHNDTLYFYNKTVLLKKLNFSTLFPNPFPQFNLSESFTFNFVDKYLKFDAYSSSMLFDISDLNNLRAVAACYGGGMSYFKQDDNYFLMKSDPRLVDLNNPYSGINEVNLSLIMGIDGKSISSKVPLKYTLFQNYPNPFNPSTIINYSIPRMSFVTIKVYDVLGREVETLVNENKPIGNYSVQFNANNLASGIYFYRMKAGDFAETKKLILLK